MKSIITSLLLAGTSGITCYLITGNSLNLFLGSFFLAAIIAGQSPGDWGMVLGVSLGFIACWWMPVPADAVTIREWAMCSAVLFTFVGALAMVVKMLGRHSPTVGSAIVTITALAWLSWPVWLSVAPSRGLILLHPLFAINHVVSDLGIWTEQQAAYNLTTLGQDVAYQLPYSAWPVITVQAGITLLFYLLAWIPHSKLRPALAREKISDPLQPAD